MLQWEARKGCACDLIHFTLSTTTQLRYAQHELTCDIRFQGCSHLVLMSASYSSAQTKLVQCEQIWRWKRREQMNPVSHVRRLIAGGQIPLHKRFSGCEMTCEIENQRLETLRALFFPPLTNNSCLLFFAETRHASIQPYDTTGTSHGPPGIRQQPRVSPGDARGDGPVS